MAQVKKQEVRDALLGGAYALFCKKGYSRTSVADIAREAGVSASNVYVYYGSKLELLYALYDPWLRGKLTELERELARIDDPRARLRRLFERLWRDIPQEDDGFANNLMQALSTAGEDEGYSRDLLRWAEDRVSDMMRDCLPPERRRLVDHSYLAHVLFMAFDGFAMNAALRGPSRRIEGVIDTTVDLLLGAPAPTTGD
eukprot:g142.t1